MLIHATLNDEEKTPILVETSNIRFVVQEQTCTRVYLTGPGNPNTLEIKEKLIDLMVGQWKASA